MRRAVAPGLVQCCTALNAACAFALIFPVFCSLKIERAGLLCYNLHIHLQRACGSLRRLCGLLVKRRSKSKR